jgi:hypothetical protein
MVASELHFANRMGTSFKYGPGKALLFGKILLAYIVLFS